MKKCPHCQFLVREDSSTCEVCSKPLGAPTSVPAFAAGQRSGEEVLAARVGPNEAAFPAAAVWLVVVGVLLAAAVVLSGIHWA
ncbi:MAG: hypothetical protein M9942_04655 [Microthrixaceae bacterium]|nr:hypothetical protein [Microthrixaceae bacterium]MCO5317712.1 hypothetical protein [Microthrixaceae bacterium]